MNNNYIKFNKGFIFVFVNINVYVLWYCQFDDYTFDEKKCITIN